MEGGRELEGAMEQRRRTRCGALWSVGMNRGTCSHQPSAPCILVSSPPPATPPPRHSSTPPLLNAHPALHAQELVSLRAERSAIQAAKSALEGDAAAVRRQLEGMKDTEAALQVGGRGAWVERWCVWGGEGDLARSARGGWWGCILMWCTGGAQPSFVCVHSCAHTFITS